MALEELLLYQSFPHGVCVLLAEREPELLIQVARCIKSGEGGEVDAPKASVFTEVYCFLDELSAYVLPLIRGCNDKPAQSCAHCR